MILLYIVIIQAFAFHGYKIEYYKLAIRKIQKEHHGIKLCLLFLNTFLQVTATGNNHCKTLPLGIVVAKDCHTETSITEH